jgi:hypothetical protein
VGCRIAWRRSQSPRLDGLRGTQAIESKMGVKNIIADVG